MMGHFSVSATSRATGLSAEVLRAWERRYGAVTPGRSDSGRRLYSPDDVQRLKLLARATAVGHSIGSISSLSTSELRGLGETSPHEYDDEWVKLRSSLLPKIESLDSRGCEMTIALTLASQPTDKVVSHLISPVLHEVGEMWSVGDLSIAHERMFSTSVRKVAISTLSQLSQRTSGDPVILGTLPGEDHELGSLLGALVVSALGRSVEFVGAGLPATEFARLATSYNAAAVAISCIRTPLQKGLKEELSTLATTCPTGTKLFLGGPAAENALSSVASDRLILLNDLSDLVGFLS